MLAATAAFAQDISVTFGQGGGLTERVLQLIALLTVLSLAPSILVMVTSFTRIVVVLSLLRTALGTATAPPNAVLISLAMFLTAFVMWPTFLTAYDAGVRPLLANEITPEQAFERASDPFRAFMQKNVRDKDLKLFVDLSGQPAPEKPAQSFRLHVYGLYAVSDKNPAESGRLDYVKEITDPSGINGNWQAVEGGFCFLTGDGKLKMIRGAAQ